MEPASAALGDCEGGPLGKLTKMVVEGALDHWQDPIAGLREIRRVARGELGTVGHSRIHFSDYASVNTKTAYSGRISARIGAGMLSGLQVIRGESRHGSFDPQV